jgi:hypothetical protein
MIDEQQPPMDMPPPDAPEAMPDQGAPEQPDGGNPDVMIGYIPEEYPAKEKTYLAAARKVIVNDQTAGILKQMLASGNDPAMTLAAFIGKTVDALETKLGPLNDDEHDRVCLVIAGWMASTLQKMGMPGMDDAGARQDFMGRVLQQLDGLNSGQPQGQQEAQEAPQSAPEAPPGPMQQFARGGP